MTIPLEERNALVYTKEFLYSLLDPRRTRGVPLATRRAAAACLRHYPMDHKVDLLYAKEGVKPRSARELEQARQRRMGT